MKIEQIPMSEVNSILSYNGLDIFNELNKRMTYVQWFKQVVDKLGLKRESDYWVTVSHESAPHFEHHFSIAATKRIIEMENKL